MEEVTKELIRELLQVLESLREVAPMVWRALVYQQVLVGVQRVVWFFFLGGCSGILVKLGFASWGEREGKEGADALAVLLWLVAFVLMVVALGQGLDGVTRWLNPSYGALETLLKQLK